MPQLVIHNTTTVEGERTIESWLDPVIGASRKVIVDASGRVLREDGWDAASGEAWVVDPVARTVWRLQTAPVMADNLSTREATFRTYEANLASGAAIDEGREPYRGVDAQRVRIPNPGGDIRVWLDTAQRRVLGMLIVGSSGQAMRSHTDYLEGDAAAQAPLRMPDASGYTGVASPPAPSTG